MIPGSRIRVMKPPMNREDLRSAEGRVVSLIPSASQPLRYKIKLATGMFEMPSTSLHLIDYHDDHDGNNAHNGDMLKVNGLCYCKDHRLEICGTCGYNFRCQNLISELSVENGVEDAVETGMDLEEKLGSAGASIRRAPAREGSEFPFDMYTPVVNDAIVGIPSGLNVITMDDFPRDKYMENSFESQFSLDLYGKVNEEPSVRPLYTVRKIFTDIGVILDSAIQEKKALPRIYLQDKAQSQVLNMDIIAIKLMVGDHVSGVKWRLPIIVVGWSHVNAGDREGLEASLRALHPGTPMTEILAFPHEMALMAKILEANAGNISTDALDFIREECALSPALRVGVIAPIGTKSNEEYYKLLKNYCEFCTATECKLFACSRCKIVQYCSKACQKVSWKKHKLECKPL